MVREKDQETNVIRQGISAVQAEDYLRGLTLLSQAYSGGTQATPEGLSFYGLAVALVEKKYKKAIDFCQKAIELQFYNPDHYANLTRVYLAAGSRKKAYEAVQQGLRMHPGDETLHALHDQLGRRSRPPLPFLSRSNPLNQMIGRARHAGKKPKPKK